MPQPRYPSILSGYLHAKRESRADKEYERQQRDLDAQEQQVEWDRLAAAYVAPLAQHRVQALEHMPIQDYYTAQMRSIQNDPGYQDFAPEVQERVLAKIRDSAKLDADNAVRRKEHDVADAILASIGQTGTLGPRQQVMERGEPWEIVRSLQAEGYPVELNEDNEVALPNGVTVPAPLFAAWIRETGTPLGGFARATERQEQQNIIDRVLAQQQEAVAAQNAGPQIDPNSPLAQLLQSTGQGLAGLATRLLGGRSQTTPDAGAASDFVPHIDLDTAGNIVSGSTPTPPVAQTKTPSSLQEELAAIQRLSSQDAVSDYLQGLEDQFGPQSFWERNFGPLVPSNPARSRRRLLTEAAGERRLSLDEEEAVTLSNTIAGLLKDIEELQAVDSRSLLQNLPEIQEKQRQLNQYRREFQRRVQSQSLYGNLRL